MIYNCCDCMKNERKKVICLVLFLCFTAIADSLFLRHITYLSSFISSVIFSKIFINDVFICYNYVENQTRGIYIGAYAIRCSPHVLSLVTP